MHLNTWKYLFLACYKTCKSCKITWKFTKLHIFNLNIVLFVCLATHYSGFFMQAYEHRKTTHDFSSLFSFQTEMCRVEAVISGFRTSWSLGTRLMSPVFSLVFCGLIFPWSLNNHTLTAANKQVWMCETLRSRFSKSWKVIVWRLNREKSHSVVRS